MARFNKHPVARTAKPSSLRSPVLTESTPSGTTAQGGAGYARDLQSELYLLAVTNMVGTGKDTFYESALARDERFAHLVRHAAGADPYWTRNFIHWLRTGAFLRTAPMVAACHALEGRRNEILSTDFSGRHFVNAALQRPDEPGEMLAYWRQAHGGQKTLPISLRRGVADAAVRLYTQRSLLKYDTGDKEFSFGKVIELCRPTPKDAEQAALFAYALDRHYRGNKADEVALLGLEMIERNRKLQSWSLDKRRALFAKEPSKAGAKLAAAGMTWETVSGWLEGPMDSWVWEALIPSMGYQALRMNLRNFDQAGISDVAESLVVRTLSDANAVVQARQWPLQLLSSYRAVSDNLTWAAALEKGIQNSLQNIPALDGLTLILVDTSSSMDDLLSEKSGLKRWDAAVIFALALAARCQTAEVVSFSSSRQYWSQPPGAKTRVFPIGAPGESLLKGIDRWQRGGYFLGGGTDTALALQKHYHGHDRVVILTDEQNGDDPHAIDHLVPTNIPMYTWNLAGYQYGHAPSGTRNRHVMGGFADAAFRQIGLLEKGQNADWPWA